MVTASAMSGMGSRPVSAIRPANTETLDGAPPDTAPATSRTCSSVITATHDILKKLTLVGKSLEEYSLETVRMFYEDARSAGFSLSVVSTR